MCIMSIVAVNLSSEHPVFVPLKIIGAGTHALSSSLLDTVELLRSQSTTESKCLKAREVIWRVCVRAMKGEPTRP